MRRRFRYRKGSPAKDQQKEPLSLRDLRQGEEAVLEKIDLPDDVCRRLMEMGFLPGTRVVAARAAPGGDPRVFRVDGIEVALRRETAAHLLLRVPHTPNAAGAP